MTRFTRVLIRVVLGAVLVLCLAAPGAGNVGGCGNGPPIANAEEHCFNERNTICLRERVAMRTTEVEFTECSNLVPATCTGAQWPVRDDGRPCEPTPAESDSCIRLLRENRYLPIPTEELLMLSDRCRLCQ